MMHWYRRPPGLVMVLVHGFAGTVHNWRDVVSDVPKNCAIVALAVPGHHREMPACAHFEASCAALAAMLRCVSDQPVHLVGYSLGGRLSLGVALRFPHLVQRLSLVGTHFGLDSAHDRRARRQADNLWQVLLQQKGVVAFADAWENQPLFARQKTDHPARFRHQHRQRLAHDPMQLAAALRTMGLGCMPYYGDQLALLRSPTQWIVGDCDAKFLALAKRAVRYGRNAQLQIMRQCGHSPLVEAPCALASALTRFH